MKNIIGKMPSGLLKAVLMHQLEFSRSLGCPRNMNSRTFLEREILLWRSRQDTVCMVRERTVTRASLHLPNPVTGERSAQTADF